MGLAEFVDRVGRPMILNSVCSLLMTYAVCAAFGWHVEGWDRTVLGVGAMLAAACSGVGGFVSGAFLGGTSRATWRTKLASAVICAGVGGGIMGTAVWLLSTSADKDEARWGLIFTLGAAFGGALGGLFEQVLRGDDMSARSVPRAGPALQRARQRWKDRDAPLTLRPVKVSPRRGE